jgi:rsbT co-antagonist protein RsbR
MSIAYLLFFPLVLLLALMTYVFFQNPRGVANRLFALYMLILSIATYVILVICTTSDPVLAEVADITLLITVCALNGAFMVILILTLFYPRSLMRWYGLPLFVTLSVLLSGGLIADAAAGTQFIYQRSPLLGHGYVAMRESMAPPAGMLLYVWLFVPILVALGLLVATWIRTRPRERMPVTLLIVSLLVGGGITPALPPNPLTVALPPLLFSIVFSIVVGRFRHLLVGGYHILTAQVTLPAVFQSAQEGMIVCGRGNLVDQVNRAAEQLIGIPSQEMVGRPLAEAIASFLQRAHQEGVAVPLAEAVRGEIVAPLEFLMRLEEPTPRLLTVVVVPILDAQAHVQGCLLSLRDVTVQERARQAAAVESRLTETIRELSAPIVPIMEGILILPLIGAVDSARASGILQHMLQAIREHRARSILIDITGVPVVDTIVANYLLQAVQAARLLGCQGILVGIRAEVARTLVELGLNLRGLVTKGSLQDGLAYALELGRGPAAIPETGSPAAGDRM